MGEMGIDDGVCQRGPETPGAVLCAGFEIGLRGRWRGVGAETGACGHGTKGYENEVVGLDVNYTGRATFGDVVDFDDGDC